MGAPDGRHLRRQDVIGSGADLHAFESRVRASLARQGQMHALSASLESVAPGLVEIAGYAALSLMPPVVGVLTTEFKINLLAPAEGERILARGRVIKAGRTLTLAQTEVFSQTAGQEKLVAFLTATLMTVEGREGVND